MIKVNLLRSVGLEQGSGAGGVSIAVESLSPEMKRQATIKTICILIFPLLIYLYERLQISELDAAVQKVQAQVAEVEQEKSTFGDTGPKMEKFATDKKRIDRQLDAVRVLTKGRLREVKSLDALQSLVPSKTWFKQVAIEGNLIKLTGYTSTDEGIVNLSKALETSALFSKVESKAAVQETLVTGPVKRFEFEFRFGRGGPE
jgi:Tfp pilus assembly protein PilN